MKLIIFFLLLTSTVRAQFIASKDVPVYALMFAAGAAYGQAEKITWHDPYSRSDYWNPYTEKQYSLNLDGYHTMRLLQYSFTVTAIVVSVNDFKKPKFLSLAKKILFCSASYWMGQQLTYNLIK